MLRTTLRTALAHKGRLVLSTLAVVLGVSFVTGTLIFTNALDRTFVSIIEGSAQDVLITPKSAVAEDFTSDRGDAEPLLIDNDVVTEAAGVEGVQAAEGGINRNGAFLLNSDGDVVGAVGPPALGVNWAQDPAVSTATITSGQEPKREGEVAVDETTFPDLGIELGEKLEVITPGGQISTTLVGVFRFGETGGLAGATVTAFVPKQAQELFAKPGKWTQIEIAVADGYSDDEVAESLRTALAGDKLEIQTRAQQVEEQSDALRQGLSFFNYFLIGFAAVSLFVAAFLIYNTFSMLVAQRSQEFALLRAIGSTRRQVLGAVLTEAILVGLVSVVIGIAGGYLLALGLTALFGSFGLSLTAGIALTPAAVGWALAIGIVVTLISALLPAVRGSRVPPVAALRESSGAREGVGKVRTVFGFIFLLGAGVLVWQGLEQTETGARASQVGIGVLLLLIAILLLAPLLGVAIVRLVSPLLSLIGRTSGKLAARNALRAPRRLATTASALTIGLALVVSVTVVTVSAKESVNALIDRSFRADLIVATETQQPFDPQIAADIRDVSGVEYVVSESGGPVQIDGQDGSLTAIGGGPLDAVADLTQKSGDLEKFGGTGAVVSSDLAGEKNWVVGDQLKILFASGQEKPFDIVGIYEESSLLTGLVIDLEEYRTVGGAAQDQLLYVVTEDGANTDQVLKDVEDIAKANPLLQVLDQTQVKEDNSAQLDQLLFFVYGLLGLSVIIAALGVVNTLSLSVVERTRELGLLRAVGATRRQVRRAVRWEAVVVSVLGAVLGIGAGLVIGIGLQQALKDAGIEVLAIPVPALIWIVVLAMVIGVLASVLPARRASRLNILDAIATE